MNLTERGGPISQLCMSAAATHGTIMLCLTHLKVTIKLINFTIYSLFKDKLR